MPSIESQSAYWDETWTGRIKDKSDVFMNAEKAYFLIKQLWSRAYLAPMEKLDIGCATGIHAIRLGQFNPLWISKWTGIDLSGKAVQFARDHNLNAICADILTFKTGMRFSVFLLLDTLEHFEDRGRLADKIKELAAEEYIVLGNVPLYVSLIHSEGGVENPINIHDVNLFLTQAGCKYTAHKVYGINGVPYMFFESSNTNRDFSRWYQ